jgi:phage gp36-like protein
VPENLAYTYTTEEDIEAILGVRGKQAALDDDATGYASADAPYWLNKAIQWASQRVNFYLNGRYEASRLAASWIVNDWATVLACYYLRSRRGNPVPSSLQDLYKATIDDLKQVQSGKVTLPDVATRAGAWPAWSNVRVDHSYPLRKVRVERGTSESRGGRPDYPQDIDLAAEYIERPF